MNQPSPPADPEKEERLNGILAEYLQRRDAGQPVDQAALLKAYPDLADGLQSYFEGEAMMGAPRLATPMQHPAPAPKQLPADLRETVRPGAMESDTSSGFTPRRFGRYELLRPLGEGAMGSVYLAHDSLLERRVALKVPKKEGISNSEFMARFTREAKAAAGLKHPNICSVFDAGEHKGTAYITMDFIDGVPLSRFIGSNKLKSLDSILKMLSTIAEAVGHAHSKGVVHRDLKPGNILIDADFKPNVTDFGLARRADPSEESRITQEGLLIGTPAYMAPEQVRGEQATVGPQSDIYSLGVILFEMLTCRLPFDGRVPEMLAKVLRDAPPVPSHVRKDLPEDVDDLCLKMLKKLPEQRFSNIAEVLAAIVKVQKKLQKSPAPTSDAVRQQAPFEIQKAHVEAMLKKGQYVAAIQDLEKLATDKSPGAEAVAEWARAALPVARAESKSLNPAGLAAILKTAEQMFQKSDYAGVIQLLEEVPSLRRTEGMEELLQKARKRETDAERLLADIKDLEHRQQIDGLEPLLKRFLKLKPGSSYGKRLQVALQSYSKTPASRRYYRFEKGRLQPMPEISFFRQWAVLGMLVGVLTFLSVSYYVLIYLKNGNQVLAVQVDDEWLRQQGGEVSLLVDGKSHTISTTSQSGKDVSIVVTLGEHTFSVKHGDTVVHDPKNFEIEKDGRRILQITATGMQLTHLGSRSTQQADNPPSHDSATDTLLSSREAPENPKSPEAAQKQPSDLDRIARGTWLRLVDSSTFLPVPEKMSFQGGVLRLQTSFIFSRLQMRDVILRAEVKKLSGQNLGLSVRHAPGPKWTQAYAAWFNGTQSDGGDLFGIAKAMSTSVSLAAGNAGFSFEQDQFVDLAISAIGDRLCLYVEGREIFSVIDGDYEAGALVLGGTDALFRNVRYQNLDPPDRSLLNPSMAAAPIEMKTESLPIEVEVPDPNGSLKNFSQVHGATAEELSAWTKTLPPGARPTWLSTRANSNPILYDAVATMVPIPREWVLQIYDHTDDKNWEEMKTTYRPAFLHVYPKDGGLERLTLWVKDGFSYEYWLGSADFMVDRLQEGLKWDQNENGFRERWLPVSFCSNVTDHIPNLSPFDMVQEWLPYHECEWELDLSFDALVEKVNQCRDRDWRPAIINLVGGSNPPRFVAILGDNPRKGKWSFSPRLTVSEYRDLLSKVDAAGGTPRCVSSRIEEGKVVYIVVWDNVEL